MRFSIHDSPPSGPENPDEKRAEEEFLADNGRCEGCGKWVPLDDLNGNRHPVMIAPGDVDFCGPVYHPVLATTEPEAEEEG